VRCHLTPALGFLPLQDLQPVQVQHFYNTLQAQGLSPRTYTTAMSSYMALCHERRRITSWRGM
jgi:hypothetical protein